MFRKGYVNIYKFYEGLFLIRLVYDVDTYHDILKKVLPYYNEGNSLQESFDLGINDYLNKDNKKLIKKR